MIKKNATALHRLNMAQTGNAGSVLRLQAMAVLCDGVRVGA